MECSSKEGQGIYELFEAAVNIAVGDVKHGWDKDRVMGSLRRRKRECRIL
jgi:hypothetical protein